VGLRDLGRGNQTRIIEDICIACSVISNQTGINASVKKRGLREIYTKGTPQSRLWMARLARPRRRSAVRRAEHVHAHCTHSPLVDTD
jgi:hypothetical protein